MRFREARGLEEEVLKTFERFDGWFGGGSVVRRGRGGDLSSKGDADEMVNLRDRYVWFGE